MIAICCQNPLKYFAEHAQNKCINVYFPPPPISQRVILCPQSTAPALTLSLSLCSDIIFHSQPNSVICPGLGNYQRLSRSTISGLYHYNIVIENYIITLLSAVNTQQRGQQSIVVMPTVLSGEHREGGSDCIQQTVWIILSWNKFNPSWSIFVLSWYKFIPTWYKFMPGSRQKILDFQIKLFTKNSEIVFSSGFQKLIVVGFESHMIINIFLSNQHTFIPSCLE